MLLFLHHIFSCLSIFQWTNSVYTHTCAYCICLPLQAVNAFLLSVSPLWPIGLGLFNIAVQSHDHPFPSLIRLQGSIYWDLFNKSNSTYAIHTVLQSIETPTRQNGSVKLTTGSNPTMQCRGIYPDYLPMLFLEINEKSLGQLRVKECLNRSWCRNNKTEY